MIAFFSRKVNLAISDGEKAYYARNSRGKMVPVQEEGWDDANATPYPHAHHGIIGLRHCLRRHCGNDTLARQHRPTILKKRCGANALHRL